MEGRGPYHIYDPGGGSEENGSTALERLVEENARLKEKMQGIKSIGNCCVPGDEICLWGSLICATKPEVSAWLSKGAGRSWGSWHWGSRKALPVLEG